MDPQELTRRVLKGDRVAFEELFHEHYSGLCQYAFRFVNDHDQAEEIVQDIFVRLWERRDRLNINHSLKSYLYQAVRNSSFNHLKHQAVVRGYEAFSKVHTSSDTSGDILVTLELEERIHESVDRLPAERKRIFLMSRDEGLRYSEIAERLGISVKTVENQIGRALKYLRKELADFLVVLWIVLINIFG